jgi:hypothetical protein
MRSGDTSMQHQSELGTDYFERLLSWLAPDRNDAGKRYLFIRSKLVKLFTYRGAGDPEQLADITIDRVSQKISEKEFSYSGDPIFYFYGVARFVVLEDRRRQVPEELPTEIEDKAEGNPENARYDCLETCLARLASSDRKMLLEYYQGAKKAKIDARRRLAESFGLPMNALRIQLCRLRADVRACVTNCLGGSTS